MDKNTKLIMRMHTEENKTGLNIYNPYFEDQGLNVEYKLFVNDQPGPSVAQLKELNAEGAITAGFEHDSVLPTLVDETSNAVKLSGRVGLIANRNGKLWAHYQGGEGLMRAIREKIDTTGKRIVVVGAGTVAKTFKLVLGSSAQITQFNRTANSELGIGGLEELNSSEGDILVNATRIGSAAEDTIFTKDLVAKFEVVADVTFGVEETNLTQIAKDQNKIVVSGWDMFTHQAAVVLREVLGHEANIERLRYFVRQGLGVSNHGAVAKKN